MKKTLCLIMLLCSLFLVFTALYAAPIRPHGPFDISGTVSEVTWFPEEFLKGKPGMSGSLGHDRVVAAHFVVKLVNYRGVSAENAVSITRYIKYQAYGDNRPSGMPPFIILKVNSKDRTLLKKGMKITDKGYSVRGDEGGTWTYYRGIKVL